jgi:hypothetical protein
VISRDSVLLQYHLLLTRSGLIDIPSAAPDLVTRLNCLKEYKARWQTLEWVASYSFPLNPNHLWELSGGVLAQGETRINFRQLMSISSNQEMQQWSIETNVPVRDFGFDHPSELVVLVHEIQPPTATKKSAKVLAHVTFSDISLFEFAETNWPYTSDPFGMEMHIHVQPILSYTTTLLYHTIIGLSHTISRSTGRC